MGSNQYWAARVYDLWVYFMTGTPEGSTESGIEYFNNFHRISALEHIFKSMFHFIYY